MNTSPSLPAIALARTTHSRSEHSGRYAFFACEQRREFQDDWSERQNKHKTNADLFEFRDQTRQQRYTIKKTKK